MDRAPPHTSKKTRAWIDSQPRLHVFHLPSYSPDWNPDEKVWNYLKHKELASHQAKNKDELKQLARRKLQSMAKRPRLMRGTFFRCCIAELFK
jgi:transposase